MGDFSRSTFDRVKHYVGVRLQQGVPLLDADWNELEDIRRYEVQAFLKWFVGDGVPAGNDGFRITAGAGGGVNTIRLTSSSAKVSVDVGMSTAAAALGFTNANRQATRGLGQARVTGEATQPFALAAGMTLVVRAEDGSAETFTFTPAGFANIAAATAAEVVAAVNASAQRVVASVGAGDDFVIAGGDGTAEGAGRCLADGRDAVHEGRIWYSSQPLYANAALAAAWGVPVVQPLAPPTTGTRSDLVYLDLWDREVTAAEDLSLVNQFVGVETCVRVRREWAVRVRPGSTALPVSGDTDFVSGHSYLALAQLVRQSTVAAIQPAALTDLRPRNLLMPPSTLVEDVLGTTTTAYRQGLNRPKVSLRDAINALLAGQLPTSPDISVSPGAGADVLNKASVVDTAGGLVAVWQAAKPGNPEQILAARLDLTRPEAGFTLAPAITSGARRLEPAAVALPDGDILVAYQTGSPGTAGTDVLMKRGPLEALGAAPEQNVAITASPTADQSVRAALTTDHVVFFTHQSTADLKQWFYRRYHHRDKVFLELAPVALSATGLGERDLHAAAVGDVVWVAYADGTKLQLLRFRPVGANPQGPPVIDFVKDFPASGGLDVFVLALSSTEALVCYDDGGGLSVAACNNGIWTTARVSGTDANDDQPAAIRDTDGTVFLVSSRELSTTNRDLVLRRRNAADGVWTSPQRLVTNAKLNQRPHPFLVPNLGLWLLWASNRAGDFDVYAKQIIKAI